MKSWLSTGMIVLAGAMLVACSVRDDYKTSPLKSLIITPMSTTAAPTETGHCVGPSQLQTLVGKQVCMEGTVFSTENWGNDFIMWYGDGRKEVYVAVRNTFYLGAEGACLQVAGVVQKDAEGRVFIRADNPGQVSPCRSK